MGALKDWFESHGDYAVEALRIFLGVVLVLKGYDILTQMNAYLALINLGGDGMAAGALAHYVIFAHIVGGAMLAIGMLTRWMALLQLPILCGAVLLLWRTPGPAAAAEAPFASVILALLAVFLVYGSGRLSVDHAVEKGRPATGELKAGGR